MDPAAGHEEEKDKESGKNTQGIKSAAKSYAERGGCPKPCGSGKSFNALAAMKNKPCAQKSDSGDNKRGDTGRICGAGTDVFSKSFGGNNGEKCGAEADKRKGSRTCGFSKRFALKSDKPANKDGKDKTYKKFQFVRGEKFWHNWYL